jgi:hypothetical protein
MSPNEDLHGSVYLTNFMRHKPYTTYRYSITLMKVGIGQVSFTVTFLQDSK